MICRFFGQLRNQQIGVAGVQAPDLCYSLAKIVPERDTILAVLSSGIGLAGLLLIFSGFLFSKAASFDTTRGDKFRVLAKLTLVPVLVTLALAWLSIMALEGNQWSGFHLLTLLKVTLGITTLLAIVGILVS